MDLFESRPIHLAPQTVKLFDTPRPDSFYYAIWSRGGNLLKTSTNVAAGLVPPWPQAVAGGIQARTRQGRREAFQFTELGECVLVGRSITADLAAIRRFAWWLAMVGGVVLALGLGGGWGLASRAIQPIDEISATAARISAGNLSERIIAADMDSELGRLAAVLNSAFARLEAAFAQQTQFTADASHELRTPIAVLISEAQTTLARERTAADYRQTLEACLDTAQQMRRLTQSLLDLARLDAGQEPLQRRPLDLAEIARDCVELIRPLAATRGLKISCELAPAPVLGDAERLGQVVTNLLTNAIHYNHEHGQIRINTRANGATAVLAVADTGIGISPADVPRIFKRFFRVDKARARGAGCTGLGLAIAKAIVEAHAGTLTVSTQLGRGSEFVVEIPSG